ncbi:ATP-binding protein [Niveispirillum irakense]|uniref:ATP-binding protein n=1 Tax=Niveispirillum irakense TaxID=34011 RepID=UPI0004240548|nr:ATP-binding protein [Niveispirillum irakense]
MDPRINPYAPGAGYPPPELAGRDDIVERASIALNRIKAGRPSRSMIFYGLRGVGKTVLLNKVRLDAEAQEIATVHIEAPEGKSLPAALLPSLRSTLIKLSRMEAMKAGFSGVLRTVSGLARALKIKYEDIEIGLDGGDDGPGGTGDLETDLVDLLDTVGRAAKAQKTAIIILIDELQYIREEQLGSLIAALHRANQNQLPVALFAAGLPQLLGLAGRARSYAERLFEYVPIDQLDEEAARLALCRPAERENVAFAEGAVAEIIQQTHGYPYFLQEWGKHSWDLARSSPITQQDAEAATAAALAELDASFFRVRFDRLTPAEKRYLRAMAELGAGPHRSGDIAEKLGRPVTTVAPTRNSLIAKGMLYSPSHGDTAFTVPLFDGFMKRIMAFPF